MNRSQKAEELSAFRAMRDGPGKGYSPGFYDRNTSLEQFEELLREQEFQRRRQDRMQELYKKSNGGLGPIPINPQEEINYAGRFYREGGRSRTDLTDIGIEDGANFLPSANRAGRGFLEVEDIGEQPQHQTAPESYFLKALDQHPNKRYAEFARRGESIHRGMQDTVSQNKQSLKDDGRYLYSGVPDEAYFAGDEGIDTSGWKKRTDIEGATGSLSKKLEDPHTLTNHYFGKGPTGKSVAAGYAFKEDHEEGRMPGKITRTLLTENQQSRTEKDPKQENAVMYKEYPGLYQGLRNQRDSWLPILQATYKDDSAEVARLLKKQKSYPIGADQIVYPGKNFRAGNSATMRQMLETDDDLSDKGFLDALLDSAEEDEALIKKAQKPTLGDALSLFPTPGSAYQSLVSRHDPIGGKTGSKFLDADSIAVPRSSEFDYLQKKPRGRRGSS